MRTRQAVNSRARRKKMLKAAKGMQHGHRRSYRLAKQAVLRGLQYSYRDRRARKRDFRRLWITRINNAAREHGITYGQFIRGLKLAEVELDRKILSELSVNEPDTFTELVKLAKSKI